MSRITRQLAVILTMMLCMTINTYATATGGAPGTVGLLIALVITVLVICGPIAIYRYSILKCPVPAPKAKKICWIYGVIAFLVFFILFGGATVAPVVLWSYLNYSMLTKGENKKKQNADEKAENNGATKTVTETQQELSVPQVLYCKTCGAKLDEVEIYCRKCGTRIVRTGDSVGFKESKGE